MKRLLFWLACWSDPWEPVFERGPWLYEQRCHRSQRRASCKHDQIGLHELPDRDWLESASHPPIYRSRLAL